MVMDGLWKAADYGLSNLNAGKFNGSATVLSDQKFLQAMSLNETFLDRNPTTHTPELPDLGLRRFSPSSSSNNEGDVNEDFDLSDVVFKYINQMLMEENIEEKSCMLHESAALQAAEKSFYDVLMVNEPPFSSPHPTVPLYDNDNDGREEITLTDYNSFGGNSFINGASLSCDVSDYDSPLVPSVSVNLDSQSRSQSSYCSSSSNSNGMENLADSPVSFQSVSNMLGSNRSAMQFQKGIGGLSRSVVSNKRNEEANAVVIKAEINKQESNSIPERTRGKKNRYPKDLDDHGRTSKQSAVYTDATVRSQMFDDVLLCNGGKNLIQCDLVHNGMMTKVQEKGNGAKGRGKKGVKKDVVDLRTLLSLCAQAIAANDQRSATDLLKQIRDNSSPKGDGMQRLAHYFSIGLEARMAGSGTEVYKELLFRPTSAVDILKAYHLYLSCCPFMKISNFFANKTILHTARNKKRLHIVDFGILYGFQWPCFIQRLSTRPGGPPELRITGVDFPCAGFRPSIRVEETGRRLANYAETFNVPFKFKAIAQKWETITIEDLELDKDETLIVNCSYRFRYLLDETVVADSPRSKVVNLIRKMEPHLFIQGVVNGSYNAPFFITRFREALFYFSSLFDMIEASVGREHEERMLIEKGIWGPEALNVIACEGGERIARPETYKQWQVRNLRAGFRQVPLNQEILKMAMDRARARYHRDFGIDEDGHWMLQGWKGRIMVALACWKPA